MPQELDWKVFHRENDRPIWLLVTNQEKTDFDNASIYNCQHGNTEFRIRTIKGGAQQRIQQCLDCGKSVGNAVKLEIDEPAPLWDHDLASFSAAEMDRKRNEIYEAALERTQRLEVDGYADYQAYLASDQWSLKRKAVLKRDNACCQACLHREGTEVHHLTYERIFEEPMFDLVAVCRPCHEKLHKRKIAAIAAAKSKSSDIPDFHS